MSSKDVSQHKYGTILGVYIPSLLTILGVIMYLRTGWVVANAGLTGAISILVVASLITLITGLSVSATATNMNIKSGGVYYMVSRCFGLESGAAIGIPLFLAQTIGITFYTMGFAESAHMLMPSLPVPLLSSAALILLAALSYFSPQLAMKAQVLILLVIVLSVLSFIYGKPLDSFQATYENFEAASFWVVFAVFFPAVTGITTGISMSGDLKDPRKSIPLGTLMAIFSGFVFYIVIIYFLWKYAPLNALNANPMIMTSISIAPALIFAGIWCSTLSSALGGLLAAPRTLQSMARDGIGPRKFGQGFGVADEPRIATALTFLIAFGINFLGGIDSIAPVLTMFFLTSYGALNLAAGLEGMTNNPSWRPSFRTPWIISILGGVGCFIAMLLINPQATFVALAFCLIVFFVTKKSQNKGQWSDIRRGLLMHMARSSIYKLADLKEDARSWRPNTMVFSGSPTSNFHLVEMANAFSQGRGFLIVSSVVPQSKLSFEKIKSLESSIQTFLHKNGVQGLPKVKAAKNYIEGIKHLIADYGLGPLTPNTILLGATDYKEEINGQAQDMAQIINTVYESKKNLLLVREENPEAIQTRRSKLNPFKQKPTKRTRIDLWWGTRNKKNAKLMLAFAYLLQTNPKWMGSELCLKSIASSAEEEAGVRKHLLDFIKASRIKATAEIIIQDKGQKPMESICKSSHDAHLVFLGIKTPQPEDSEYKDYYEKLIASTESLPQVVFMLAGESLNFNEIFV